MRKLLKRLLTVGAIPSSILLASCGGRVADDAGASLTQTGADPRDSANGDAASGGVHGSPESVCDLPADCGTTGTVAGCAANECPGNAACTLAYPRGTSSGGRVACGVQSCVATCSSNSDCPSSEECVSPRSAPWNTFIEVLDDDQEERMCLPIACGGP